MVVMMILVGFVVEVGVKREQLQEMNRIKNLSILFIFYRQSFNWISLFMIAGSR